MANRSATFLLSCVLAVVIAASAVAAFVRTVSPAGSLRINPLHAEAALATADRWLAREDLSPSELAIVDGLLLDAAANAPAQARLIGALAMVRFRRGRTDEARSLSDAALRLDRTDPHSLILSYLFALQDGSLSRAADLAATIALRARQFWPTVEANLPALLANPEGANALRAAMGATQAGRARFVRYALDSGRLGDAYRFVLQWYGTLGEEVRPLVVDVVNALVGARDTRRAYFLFRQTIAPRLSADTGYVFDARFRTPPGGTRFQWNVYDQPGMSLEWIPPIEGAQSGGRMVLRMRDAPLQLSNLKQVLQLTPGLYELSVDYRTRGFSGPDPLQFVIRCLAPGRNIVALPLPATDRAARTASATFRIPDPDCQLMEIQLATASGKAGWRKRYAGSLELSRVALTRRGET